MYVDDVLCARTTKDLFESFTKELSGIFPIKGLGEAKWLLGIHVERNRTQGWVRLSQEAYVDVILQRFRMQDCKPARTPYSAPVLEQGKDETIKFPFRELIGHYMYLSNMTRPDICHAVGDLSRYVSCFNESHVISVKRIISLFEGHIELWYMFSHELWE